MTPPKRRYGYRRIVLWLRQKRAMIINHKAVLRLMNRLGIHSIARQTQAVCQNEPVGDLSPL